MQTKNRNKVFSALTLISLAFSCSMPLNTNTSSTVPQNNSSGNIQADANPQLTSSGKIKDTPEKNIGSNSSDTNSDITQPQPSQLPVNTIPSNPSYPYPMATANSSTNPSGNTGSSSDIKDLATFNGRVYGKDGLPLEGATVTAKSIDPNVSWVGEAQQTVGGAYVFRNAPVGARIQLEVTKDGITQNLSTVLKSNLQGDILANVFNFNFGNNSSQNSAVITGKVFDINGKALKNSIVKVESMIGNNTSQSQQVTTDENGFYKVENISSGAKVKITVTSPEGKTKSREAVLTQQINNIDFGGDDKTFAITSQNENFFVDYGVNPFINASSEKLSTFSVDVDTASYTWMRKSILTENVLPERSSVRIEEFINFFDYGYPLPAKDSFTINTDLVQSPVGETNSKIFRIGLQGKSLQANETRKPVVLTFVIDISGSMNLDNRLGLVKKSLNLLVDNLDKNDRIGIVAFGTESRVVLPSISADNKNTIKQAINSLEAENSTNTESGLLTGFDLAGKNYIVSASNRVILCSDGVANVGETGPDRILEEIKKRSESGIFLSTIGFGMGNYNDTLMEQLANKGDGNYAYVDTLDEAYRIFSQNLAGTLQTIAKDVKIQVEFNPATVRRYRLMGYENRAIQNQDFRNDKADAGEIGINNSVTALYEVELINNKVSEKVAEVFLRYKDSNDLNRIKEFNKPVYGYEINNNFSSSAPSFKMATASAMFAEILRHSYWAKDARFSDVIRITKEAEQGYDNSKKINEFLSIVDKASKLPTR